MMKYKIWHIWPKIIGSQLWSIRVPPQFQNTNYVKEASLVFLCLSHLCCYFRVLMWEPGSRLFCRLIVARIHPSLLCRSQSPWFCRTEQSEPFLLQLSSLGGTFYLPNGRGGRAGRWKVLNILLCHCNIYSVSKNALGTWMICSHG